MVLQCRSGQIRWFGLLSRFCVIRLETRKGKTQAPYSWVSQDFLIFYSIFCFCIVVLFNCSALCFSPFMRIFLHLSPGNSISNLSVIKTQRCYHDIIRMSSVRWSGRLLVLGNSFRQKGHKWIFRQQIYITQGCLNHRKLSLNFANMG